jgi:hypothetical protein
MGTIALQCGRTKRCTGGLGAVRFEANVDCSPPVIPGVLMLETVILSIGNTHGYRAT